MDPNLYYVFGPILVVAAIAVTAMGLRNPDFPSPALFRVGLGVFVGLVALTTTWAVVQARDEQHSRREKEAQKAKAAASQAAPLPAPAGATTGSAAAGTPAATGAGATLELAADKSQLAYDTDKLEAKAGKVTIDFNNPSAIQHDVTIEKGSEQIAKSDLVAAGKTSVSANLAAGTYVFFCSVPGHRQAGMQGTLTVK